MEDEMRDVVDEAHENGDVLSSTSLATSLAQSPIDGVKQSFYQLRKEVADRSTEMRETLRRFQGRVFHAVSTSHGPMLIYRVGLDGKIKLEKIRTNGIYVTAEKLQEARQNIVKAGKDVNEKAQRKWRKVVTGDPEKRIRDHMRETPQVKMLDKFSFTMGVIVICFAEWLILRMPNHFPYFYYGLMAALLAFRYYEYSKIKSELYMVDFCYFVNLSVVLQTAFCPDCDAWFKANYTLSMGPICIAVVVWRNSLVFHSLDKVTSFFLHAFPTMMCHIYRWKLVHNHLNFDNKYMGYRAHFVDPITFYFVWQIGYLVITEILLKSKLEADPDYVTSLRYLAKDDKNGANRLVAKFCRKFGYLGKDEAFDPETMLAKVVFVLAQMSYTLVTIVHPPLLYMNYDLSCFYLVAVFTKAVWNGASYYIEVFSKRYNLKFDAKPSEDANAEDNNRENEDDFDDEFTEALEDLNLIDFLDDQILTGDVEPDIKDEPQNKTTEEENDDVRKKKDA